MADILSSKTIEYAIAEFFVFIGYHRIRKRLSQRLNKKTIILSFFLQLGDSRKLVGLGQQFCHKMHNICETIEENIVNNTRILQNFKSKQQTFFGTSKGLSIFSVIHRNAVAIFTRNVYICSIWQYVVIIYIKSLHKLMTSRLYMKY